VRALVDEPFQVFLLLERQGRGTQVFQRVEDLDLEELILECSDELLRPAVASRCAYEGGGGLDAEKPQV